MAQPLRYEITVKRGGKVNLPKTPFKAGTRLKVILIKENAEKQNLLKASESSTDFWYDSIDDETWNDT